MKSSKKKKVVKKTGPPLMSNHIPSTDELLKVLDKINFIAPHTNCFGVNEWEEVVRVIYPGYQDVESCDVEDWFCKRQDLIDEIDELSSAIECSLSDLLERINETPSDTQRVEYLQRIINAQNELDG